MKSIQIKFRLLFFFILAAELICAQTELTPGYIIKQSGDILQGDIEMKTDTIMERVCNFHISGKDTVYHYFPNEIRGYGITDGDQYASKQLKGVPVFMKRIDNNSNQINAHNWYYRDKTRIHYYSEKPEGQLSEIPYYVDNKMLFGQWCVIHTNDSYDLKNTIVTNVPPVIKKENYSQKAINLEIIGGGVFHGSLKDYQAGLLLNICNPQSNGNFRIRTGIQKLGLFDTNNNSILRIPIQFEGRLNDAILIPRVAVGLNYYTSINFIAPTVMIGMNLRLSRSISMTLTYDIDYEINDLIYSGDTYFLQSLSTGFIIGLK